MPQRYAQSAPHTALDGLLSLFDFEAEAQKHVSGAWARISGAAADELRLRWNHEVYEHIRLKGGRANTGVGRWWDSPLWYPSDNPFSLGQ